MIRETVQRTYAFLKIQAAQNRLIMADIQAKKAWENCYSQTKKNTTEALIRAERGVEIAEEKYNNLREKLCLEY